MTIILTPTGERIKYHNSFFPYVLKADKELPKQYNQGLNSFRFVGGEPDFIGKDMPKPKINEVETENYLIYDYQVIIFRENGDTLSGNYTNYVEKATGKERPIFKFD